MPSPVEFHPAAVDEAEAAALWYAARSPRAARAFDAELAAAVDRIAESPLRWRRHLHGTRRVVLRRFPYLVVYRVDADRVLIVAVAHGHRRPGFWRGR
jgi:plasmid stabilization system protein ParE